MDKLSEHAIRMLEIADKPYCNEYGMINKDLRDKHDISRAVYDLILQVQMLKEVNRKTEPSSSEIPNNCEVKNYCDDCLYTDTCDSKEFFYACTSKATISKMEQVEDEPQTERSNNE